MKNSPDAYGPKTGGADTLVRDAYESMVYAPSEAGKIADKMQTVADKWTVGKGVTEAAGKKYAADARFAMARHSQRLAQSHPKAWAKAQDNLRKHFS